MKKFYWWLFIFGFQCLGCWRLQGAEVPKIPIITDPPSLPGATAFAIIVDSTTFVKVGSSILQYRKSIENDGLPTYVIVAAWSHPAQLRQVIQELYQQQVHKLEGVVFIGNIPIVMLREAQFLTSAFRMDQSSRSFIESSVPTDRFYDDLDLKCEYIRQDSTHHLLHYYKLSPDSPLRLERDLYSARIPLPPENENGYKILKQFFKKAVRIKNSPHEPLDNVLTMTGNNYISDSQAAIFDEWFTLREILGLNQQITARATQLFHLVMTNPKQQLFHWLNQTGGDLFILHSHGNETAQFLQEKQSNNLTPDENAASTARDANGTPDEAAIKFDEISQRKIASEVVLLDVCYNGAFHQPLNMALAYLYSPGEVVTVMSNSVNVRQDIALIENLGALSFGARLGQWHQMENYLESHLFGDPTFRFASLTGTKLKANPPFERFPEPPLAQDELIKIFSTNEWPYLRASALAALAKYKAPDFPKYLQSALKDPSNVVRLKAWLLFASQRSEEFAQAVPNGINDSYELIRRYSTLWMGEIGSNNYVQHLARAATSDPSERVVFNALIALKLIGTKEARTALKWILSELNSYDGGKFIQQVRANLFTMTQWLPNEVFPPLTTGNKAEKLRNIRLFRANRHLIALPILIFLYEKDSHPEVRMAAAETLGWYTFYEKRNLILDTFSRVLAQPDLDADLKAVTIMAQQRLLQGPNKPNTP
ncbi:C25 family cysteine peptidase [candidate division KSB1 bacterium]|nr:C25 family cysteine peptidase [candidate division KSB1 bacterium]